MRGIVVDENVVREAVEGKKPDGTNANAEAEFMHRLFQSSNTVFVNSKIEAKFYGLQKKIDRGQRRAAPRNDAIYVILAGMLNNRTRISYVEGTKVEMDGLKKCDKEFVGVALQTRSVLVTSDARLCGILEDCKGTGQGVECLTPDKALELLCVEERP